MKRLHLSFECREDRCAATLDSAPGTTGLLMVSGGNEIRAGAFNGQSRLAAEIAAAGFPVFRFDRRGIGDSEGTNRGFRKSTKDIAAALLAFETAHGGRGQHLPAAGPQLVGDQAHGLLHPRVVGTDLDPLR